MDGNNTIVEELKIEISKPDKQLVNCFEFGVRVEYLSVKFRELKRNLNVEGLEKTFPEFKKLEKQTVRTLDNYHGTGLKEVHSWLKLFLERVKSEIADLNEDFENIGIFEERKNEEVISFDEFEK